MKLVAGVKPDYIGENKPTRTNLTLVSLDVVECLTTHPSSNSDKIISNLSVAPLPWLIFPGFTHSFFSLCGVATWANRRIRFSKVSPCGSNNFVGLGGLTLNF